MNDVMIGETVGSYRIVRQLGEGGMGVVYLAEHPLLKRRAAVKMLLPSLSCQKEIVERFFNEARASTLIDHPGIIDVFDFGYHSTGMAFIVMELLDGESLAARLHARGRLSAVESVSCVAQLCSALGAAHGRGIVHRDLKPDNLFMVPDPDMPGGERLKVLDFGIAKLTGHASWKTQSGMMMGTPAYMAPEQLRSAADVDARADIYAIGCILYEMVCGQPPFLGDDVGQIIAGHLVAAPVPPRCLVPDLPPDLEQLILRLLAKNPADRPQTAYAVMAETRSPVVTGQFLSEPRASAASAGGLAATARTVGPIAPQGSGRIPVAVLPGASTTLSSSAAVSTTPLRPMSLRRVGAPVLGLTLLVGMAITWTASWRPTAPVGPGQAPVAAPGSGAHDGVSGVTEVVDAAVMGAASAVDAALADAASAVDAAPRAPDDARRRPPHHLRTAPIDPCDRDGDGLPESRC